MPERRWSATSVWLVLLLAAGAYLGARLKVATDMTAFMPQGQQPVERLLVQELRQGPASRLILGAIIGGSQEERAAASRALAGRLRSSGLFERVLNGGHELDPRGWELVFAYRYLLSERTRAGEFGAEALRRALQRRLSELRSPLSVGTKKLLPADPTGAALGLVERWRAGRQPEERDGVWVSADGSRALLLFETRAAGLDLDRQLEAEQAINAAFNGAHVESGLRLLLSGPSILAVESRALIRDDAQRLSWLAGGFVAGLLMLAYRSVWLAALAALPLATGILLATAVVVLAWGEIHGITLAFGMTVLGVAVDYPIHFFGHLQPDESPTRTAARIWPTLRLGVLTTVFGYFAMLGTDFPGLGQLGLFAIAGLVGAAGVTRWVLPELVMTPMQGSPAVRAGRLYRMLARPPALGPWLVIAIALGCAVLVAGRGKVWQDDLMALSPIPREKAELDHQLRELLKAPDVRHLFVVSAADVEGVLRREEALLPKLQRLVATGDLGGFDLAARYLPSQRTQAVRRAALPSREDLGARLRSASEGLPFREGLFAPFLDDIEKTRALPPLDLKAVEGTDLGLRLGGLLVEGESGWLGLVTLRDVRNISTLIALANGPQIYYLDLKTATEELVRGFREVALLRVLVGALVTLGALWLGLRSVRRLAAVAVPMVGAVALAVGTLLLLGEPLNLFHLISLLLVVGIGCDYALFFTRQPMAGGQLDRRDVRAVSLCALSTLGVFALLASSAIPVLRAIGGTVSIGVAGSFLFAWLSTPLAQGNLRS
jgi:predicted exporter